MIQHGQILLDENGQLTSAAPSRIFIPVINHQRSSHLRFVNHDLLAQQGVLDALEIIGIKQATPSLELTAFIRTGLRSDSPEAWDDFWVLVRAFRGRQRRGRHHCDGAQHRPQLYGRSAADNQPLSRILLPGSVVTRDGSRDREVTLDVDFHRPDLEVLQLLGAGQVPAAGYPIQKDTVVDVYHEFCVDMYIRSLPTDSPKPQWDRMVFERKSHVGSLEPLQYLSEEGRAAFTEELIRSTSDWQRLDTKA